MGTKAHRKRTRSGLGLEVTVRLRISREIHDALDALRQVYTRTFNDQARRCLELGVEAEKQGGVEHMLNAEVETAVREQVADAMRTQAKQLQVQLNEFEQKFEKRLEAIIMMQSKRVKRYDGAAKSKEGGSGKPGAIMTARPAV